MKRILLLLSFIVITLGSFYLGAGRWPMQGNFFNASRGHTVFSPQQISQLEQLIHDYLLQHPELLLELNHQLQQQVTAKQNAQLEKTKQEIAAHKEKIFQTDSIDRIISGNPDGEITVAIFTQHPCPACKQAHETLDHILQQYPEVKLVSIFWPFLGETAIHSAKIVIAAKQQQMEKQLNSLLFQAPASSTREQIDQLVALQPGLDWEQLTVALQDHALNKALAANTNLADALTIPGTPSLILTNRDQSKIILISEYSQRFEEELIKAIDELKQTS